LGWQFGLPIFFLDLAKGLVPVLVARHEFAQHPWIIVLAGIAPILGHSASPFLGFKGGKGVATSLGVAIALSPLAAAIAFATWAILVAITRYVSLASVLGTPVGAVLIVLFNPPIHPAYVIFSTLAVIFVIVKHKSNITRLREGTESKFSWGKS
jgi:glycerol-3-phosphate acyltransferase PlsY